MSLILDALRKSERTRQQTLTGRLSATDAARGHARVPVPWATLIGILLVANALVLAIIFWRAHSGSAPQTASAARAPAITATANTPVYRPQVRSLAVEAAANSTAKPAVRLIAPAAPAATPVSSVAATTVQATGSSTASPPATAKPQAGISASNENVPLFDTLPLAFQQLLPPLHMEVHSYSQNPADSFVVINMQRYQTGETLKEGPKIISITPEGAVLEYDGQKFLLPRL